MNAISPAMASTIAAPSAITITAMAQRLAEVDRLITAIQEEDFSEISGAQLKRAAWRERVLEQEREHLEELTLLATPTTITDAAAMAMIMADEIRGVGCGPGPDCSWQDTEKRGELLAKAVQRLSWCLLQIAGVDPRSLGGDYYLSLLMRDHGLRPECGA